MLQFRHRRTHILTCLLKHDHNVFTCQHDLKEVTEAIGTGLAIQYVTQFQKPLSPLAPATAYGLVHLSSGTVLTAETAPTIISAAMWLRSILPLFDWTLPQEAFKKRQDTAFQVHWTLIEVIHEYNRLLRCSGETRGALWYTA